MCRCVWSRNLKNEEAMARAAPQGYSDIYIYIYIYINIYIIVIIIIIYQISPIYFDSHCTDLGENSCHFLQTVSLL